jgi:hypothetical protein
MTILRGNVVAEEGKILGEPGDGAFLKRRPTRNVAARKRLSLVPITIRVGT